MDHTDAFFTQTVVGAPFTAMLGRRRTPGSATAQGLTVDLRSGQSRLSSLWQDWVVLSHAMDPPGRPRIRPSQWRLLLERHALWVALLGLVSLIGSLLVWGWLLWT